jgi:hypothetical protein
MHLVSDRSCQKKWNLWDFTLGWENICYLNSLDVVVWSNWLAASNINKEWNQVLELYSIVQASFWNSKQRNWNAESIVKIKDRVISTNIIEFRHLYKMI